MAVFSAVFKYMGEPLQPFLPFGNGRFVVLMPFANDTTSRCIYLKTTVYTLCLLKSGWYSVNG
jgi:hypothetical protein